MLSPFSSVVFIQYKNWFIISQAISTFLIIPHIQSQFKILVYPIVFSLLFSIQTSNKQEFRTKISIWKIQKTQFQDFFLNSYKTNFLDYWNDFFKHKTIFSFLFFSTNSWVLSPKVTPRESAWHRDGHPVASFPYNKHCPIYYWNQYFSSSEPDSDYPYSHIHYSLGDLHLWCVNMLRVASIQFELICFIFCPPRSFHQFPSPLYRWSMFLLLELTSVSF